MEVRRLPITLRPEASRVLVRPFWPTSGPGSSGRADSSRAIKIISRVLSLTEEETERQWRLVCSDFGARHPEIECYFTERFEQLAEWMPTDAPLSEVRRWLIGAYFTHEYSLEAAALFNPSVVACPDQSGLPEGALRFVLSLRAVGEGHISSMCFRCGVLTPDLELELGEAARWVVEPRRNVDESFHRGWFEKKSHEGVKMPGEFPCIRFQPGNRCQRKTISFVARSPWPSTGYRFSTRSKTTA